MPDLVTESHIDLELQDVRFFAHEALRTIAIWPGIVSLDLLLIGLIVDSNMLIVIGLALAAGIAIGVPLARDRVLAPLADSSGRYRVAYRLSETRLEAATEEVTIGVEWTSFVQWQLSNGIMHLQTASGSVLSIPLRLLPRDFVRDIETRIRELRIPAKRRPNWIRRSITVLLAIGFALMLLLFSTLDSPRRLTCDDAPGAVMWENGNVTYCGS